jgi:hypothetical protein
MNEEEAKDQIANVLDNLSEEELRKVAADFVENRIFTTMQIRKTDADMLQVIFIPLMFIVESGAWMANAAFLYEYMDKAGLREANGYPCFFSVKKLTKHDYPAFVRYVEDYKAIKEQFFSAPPPAQI